MRFFTEQEDYWQLRLFGWIKRIFLKVPTKFLKGYKISTGTKNPHKCSKCYLILFWNPVFEHRCYWYFFLKGKTKSKSQKTCGPLLLEAPKLQKRFGSAFWHKIVTTPLRYFSLVALYYCKIRWAYLLSCSAIATTMDILISTHFTPVNRSSSLPKQSSTRRNSVSSTTAQQTTPMQLFRHHLHLLPQRQLLWQLLNSSFNLRHTERMRGGECGWVIPRT